MRKPSDATRLVHGTAVSLSGLGVLIRGAPGSGKSDLALRLIETTGTGLKGENITGRLVSDDQTELFLLDGDVHARAPKTIAGKIEVRGLDIIHVPFIPAVRIVLVVDLKPWAEIERLPDTEARTTELLGKPVTKVDIDPASASAASRVRVAVGLAWSQVPKLS